MPVFFDGCDRLVGPRNWLPRCGQQIHILPPPAPVLGGVEARIDACERASHGERASWRSGTGAVSHAVPAASVS